MNGVGWGKMEKGKIGLQKCALRHQFSQYSVLVLIHGN